MVRAVIVLCLLLAGCGTEEPGAGGSSTKLLVTVDADGPKGAAAPSSREVRCSDTSGCAAERVPASAYQPVQPRKVCTDIFGGPQTAEVTGTLRGKPVSARFSRQNGCEIDRWQAAKPLLEP
jgi:hypothetical protein